MICCEQEKLAIKEKKEADEAKFKYAQVDGRTEQVYVYSLSTKCAALSTWHKPMPIRLYASSYLATSGSYASPISKGSCVAFYPDSSDCT